jgi:hypothetical protein
MTVSRVTNDQKRPHISELDYSYTLHLSGLYHGSNSDTHDGTRYSLVPLTYVEGPDGTDPQALSHTSLLQYSKHATYTTKLHFNAPTILSNTGMIILEPWGSRNLARPKPCFFHHAIVWMGPPGALKGVPPLCSHSSCSSYCHHELWVVRVVNHMVELVSYMFLVS